MDRGIHTSEARTVKRSESGQDSRLEYMKGDLFGSAECEKSGWLSVSYMHDAPFLIHSLDKNPMNEEVGFDLTRVSERQLLAKVLLDTMQHEKPSYDTHSLCLLSAKQ